MKNYYIEIVDRENGEYVMQSRYFDTKRKAVNWLRTNWDYIDVAKVGVCIMTTQWSDDGDSYDITESEEIY